MLTETSTIVVVGTGLAGLRTVEALRQRGFAGNLVVLGAEAHLPYDRPPLSKAILRGESDVAWLRPADAYADLSIDLRPGSRARSLDIEAKVVVSEDGEHPYDVVVIATGATPRRVPGLNGLVLRTLDDARDLRAALRPDTRLAVVGAGLVGCEVAASARSLGLPVDLVDVLAGPLIRVVGAKVAEVVGDLHRRHGVHLHFGVGASRAADGKLALSDGTNLDADVVLEAIGASPDTDWLAGSGLSLQDGIVCDADGRAADGVYAVGDVARWDGVRIEHWTNAGEQAAHVAAVVLGEERPTRTVAYWWSDQYEFKIQGLGVTGGEHDVQVLNWGPKARTVALYSRDGALTGVVGFSAPAAIMRLRNDIMAGTPVDEVAARLAG
jgi:3-phenylpropionate/trans-cinnamate dioxygenase ferredoxin reductase subunit